MLSFSTSSTSYRGSVVISLLEVLRGQASLKRKIILNHLAKNIRDASSKYSLKPDHLPGVLQISVPPVPLDGNGWCTCSLAHMPNLTWFRVQNKSYPDTWYVVLTRYIQWFKVQNC
jgi:hypothetical protein